MTNGILSTGNDNYGRQAMGGTTAVGGGSLILRCTAQIVDLYQEYKEIELGSPQHRDPVPARGKYITTHTLCKCIPSLKIGTSINNVSAKKAEGNSAKSHQKRSQ